MSNKTNPLNPTTTQITMNQITTFVSNQYIPHVLIKDDDRISPFQNQVLFDIASDTNFDFFCGKPVYDGKPGPITAIYYTKDGVLHVVKIGRKRIIQHCN